MVFHLFFPGSIYQTRLYNISKVLQQGANKYKFLNMDSPYSLKKVSWYFFDIFEMFVVNYCNFFNTEACRRDEPHKVLDT